MFKNVQQLRNLEMIENELKNNYSGILSFYTKEEKIVQLAVTFIYLDKNVYIFPTSEDEQFDKIHIEVKSSFTVIKNIKPKKRLELDNMPTYDFLSISIKGFLKKVEEQKLIDDLVKNYFRKYVKEYNENVDSPGINKVFYIDTEEIQAFEETGG
ncbi:MAG: hypothetical protein ACYDA4_03435 [Ignavibacteriaceae bacterium]